MPSRLCEHCTAACCRYIALPLDKPVLAEDFDDIRWYLAHENVTVFVDKGQWYISFATPCRYLGRDFRCSIYRRRPRICRGYRTGACDYHGGEYRYDLLFCEPAQIERYAAEWLGRRKKGRSGKRKE